jgi:hypothetical protein
MIDALQRSIHFLDFLRRRDDEKIEIISRRLGTLPLRHSASLPLKIQPNQNQKIE